MEVLTAAGLALAGSLASRTNAGTRRTLEQAPRAQAPETPAPLPVVSPARAEYLSDRNLESYVMGNRASKATMDPPLFRPVANTFDQLSPAEEAVRRYGDAKNQREVFNNVSPVDAQRVGPGIGLGYEDVARDTGFHETFRILPGNVNGYRRNTEMPSRVIAGKAINENAQSRPEVRDPKNASTMEAPAPVRVGGATKRGPWWGEFRTAKSAAGGGEHEYLGVAKGAHEAPRAPLGDVVLPSPRAGSEGARRVGNPASARDGAQAYQGSQYLTYPNQRSDAGSMPILGGHVRTRGDVQHVYGPEENVGQRGVGGGVPVLGGHSAYERSTVTDIDVTASSQRGSGSVLLPGKGATTKHHRPQIQLEATQRETQGVSRVGPGGRGNGQGNYTLVHDSFEVRERPTTSHTPHGGRLNVLTHAQFGQVDARNPELTSRVPQYARSDLAAYPTEDQLGRVETAPLLPNAAREPSSWAVHDGPRDVSRDVSRFASFW